MKNVLLACWAMLLSQSLLLSASCAADSSSSAARGRTEHESSSSAARGRTKQESSSSAARGRTEHESSSSAARGRTKHESSKPADAGVTLISAKQIYTVDSKQAKVTAFAFDQSGKILAIGRREDLLASYPQATHHQYPYQTIVPGLIDAHGHLLGLGLQLRNVDLVDTKSVAEVIDRLKAAATQQPNEQSWLIGRGWDQNDWANKQFPSAKDLDAAFPDRPVWLERVDGHAGWANSAAIKLASRLLDGDWQPNGGKIMRVGKQATGVLIDNAMALIDQAVPALNITQRQALLRRAVDEAARFGLTGVHDAGTSLADYRILESMAANGELPIRVYAMADGDQAALAAICPADQPIGAPLRSVSNRLEMRAVKLYIDGALGSRGAALLETYSDDATQSGLLMLPAAQFSNVVERLMRCGLQINTHAIGDRGNRVVLDTLKKAQTQFPNSHQRHRIEHAQVVHPDDLMRFAELNIIASMQPTHATSDMPWAQARLGALRLRGAYAWQTMLKLKVPLALGSDFPVEPVSPWLGLYAAITRQDATGMPKSGWQPQEKLSRAQALYGFTMGAAYAGFAEHRVGSISVGKQADFVLIDRDVMTIPVKEILETRVLKTFVDGREAFILD